MPYGRFGFGPFRYGRAARSFTELILASLIDATGTALATDDSTHLWSELNAIARSINSVGSQLRRLRNQFDPTQVTEFLPRWERIFSISPAPDATEQSRREELARRFAFLGTAATRPGLYALLRDILPDLAPTVVHTSSTEALTHCAPGGVGVHVPGGIHTPSETGVTWSSSIAHVLVLVTRPAWMTAPAFNALFYGQAARVHRYLDEFLPSWTTYAYAADLHGFPTSSRRGFYLDETDLDIERLYLTITGPTIGGGAFTQEVFPYSISRNVGGESTYCNYYQFEVAAPAAVTIDVSRSTGFGLALYVIAGPNVDGSVVATGVTAGGSKHLVTGMLPAGSYVLEVSSNAVDVIDGETSPFTATITLT